MIKILRPCSKPVLGILATITILVAGAIGFVLLPGITTHENHYCRLDSSGRLLDTCVPLLKIVNGTNDTIRLENNSVPRALAPAPPDEECRYYAEIALEPYGGLPGDAVLTGIESGIQGGTWNPTTKVSGPTIIETRRIKYLQKPYGMSIVGKGGTMTVEIAANGVLHELAKRWFTLEETGLTPVIPQSEAIQRLRNGQCRNLPDIVLNLTIHDMTIGYSPPVNVTTPQYLEPVWIMNATDEIRGRSLHLFVPAEPDGLNEHAAPDIPVTRYRNFALVRNDSIPSDIVYPSESLWLAASGPVGKETASGTIKSFTENRDIKLTYHGRFTEQGSGGCGGVSFFWDYYEFSTPDCNFKVDSYTGTMLSAMLNSSCSDAGIRNYTFEDNIPTNATIIAAVNLTKARYYHFDQRHLKLEPFYTWSDNNVFFFSGDRGLDSDYGVRLVFRPDGFLMRYTNDDDVMHWTCSGGNVIKTRLE